MQNGSADNRCCKEKHSASDRERLGQLSMKSPGGAAITERLLQSRFVVKGVQEPTNESVPESVKVWKILKIHCIELLGG